MPTVSEGRGTPPGAGATVAVARESDDARIGTRVRTLRAWRGWRPTPRHWSAVPALLLLVIPLVAWTGPTSSRMSLGGDAGLLFFSDPWAWVTHSSTTLVSGGISGYNAQSQFIPFCLLLRGFQILGLNAQGITFGAVLAMGFLGTRAVCLELTGARTTVAYVAACVAGGVYVSTPLVAETQWASLLPRFLWLGLLPVLTALLMQHQREGGAWRVVVGAFVIALMAPACPDVPGSAPALLALATVATVAWLARSVQLRVRRLLAWVLTVLTVNAFWIIPNFLSAPLGGTQVAAATSGNGKRAALDIVTALAPLQRVHDTVAMRPSGQLLRAYDSVQLQVDRWPMALSPLGYLPVALVLIALVGGRTHRRLLGLISAGGLVFLYLQTINGFPGGLALYAFLTRHVPGWTAVRNFYVTWPLAFVFLLATTAGVAVHILGTRTVWPTPRARTSALVGGIVAGLLVLYDGPFYVGQVFRLDYQSTIPAPRAIDGLPPNFRQVIDYLDSAAPGNVLSLPLLSPAWTAVRDSPAGQLYLGISPVSYLTGRSDYNGIDSFSSASLTGLDDSVRDSLTGNDVASLATLVGRLGVRYVVVNTSLDASSGFLGLSAAPNASMEQKQTDSLLRRFAPTTLATFGVWQVRRLEVPGARNPIDLVQLPLTPATDRSLRDVVGGLAPAAGADACAESVTVRLEARLHTFAVDAHNDLAGCALTLGAPFTRGWTASVTGGDRNGRPVFVTGTRAADGTITFALPAALATGRQVRLTRRGRGLTRVERGAGVSLERAQAIAPLCAGTLRVEGTAVRGATVRPTGSVRDCALVLSETYSSQWAATLSRPGAADLPLRPARIDGGLLRFDLPAELTPGSVIKIRYRANRLLVESGLVSALALALGLGWPLVEQRRRRRGGPRQEEAS